MRIFLAAILTLAGVQVAGCKTKAGDSFQPALVTDSAASRDGLKQGLKQLFNGMDILIASDAFVEKSTIVLERKPIRSLEGNLSSGVVEQAPQKVELVTDGRYCYLTRVGTDLSVRLEGVSCQPIEH
jgi:hypothetical protein